MRAILALGLVATVLALPAAATAHRSDLAACELIPTAKLASVLGFQHVQILRDLPGTSASDNVSGVTHSVCNGVAWNGAAPTSPAGVKAALVGARGAGFAIDTWAPDDASTYVDTWRNKGFESLVSGGVSALLYTLGFPGQNHLQRLLPVGGKPGVDGAIGALATPTALPGVRTAGGGWWAYPSYAVVAIGIEGAASDPSLGQLNELAKVGVTAFGLKPLTLKQK
jgi:hypothetical protein